MVQDIFAQVDEALQQRKAENIQLQNDMSNCESQLKYLQSQTKEQSTLNAACSVSISMTEHGLEKLDKDIGLFQADITLCSQHNQVRFVQDHNESKIWDYIIQMSTFDFHDS